MILVRHQRRAEAAAAADSEEDNCATLDQAVAVAVLVTRGEVSIPDKMSNLECQINFMGLIKGCLLVVYQCTEAPIAPWSRLGPAIVGNWSDLSPFGHFLIKQEFRDQVLAPDCGDTQPEI